MGNQPVETHCVRLVEFWGRRTQCVSTPIFSLAIWYLTEVGISSMALERAVRPSPTSGRGDGGEGHSKAYLCEVGLGVRSPSACSETPYWRLKCRLMALVMKADPRCDLSATYILGEQQCLCRRDTRPILVQVLCSCRLYALTIGDTSSAWQIEGLRAMIAYHALLES